MVNVPRRRNASDLYARGRALVLDDGGTEWVEDTEEDGTPKLDADGRPILVEVTFLPVTVWISKLSDLEITTCQKKAAAAQAVTMAGRKNPESEDWQAMRATVGNLEREVLVAYIVQTELIDRRALVEARLAGQMVINPSNGDEMPTEWAKDGYIEGLYEAWQTNYKAIFARDPDDPEALRILSEIDRFNQEVDKEYEYEVEIERQLCEGWDDDTLAARMTDLLLEAEASSAWADEYKLRVIALCTRDCEGVDPDRPDKCLCRGANAKHTDLHFKGGYPQVVSTDGRIRQRIWDVFHDVQVEPLEGKGLPAKPASSTPSDSPAAVSTSSSPPA